MRSGPAATCSAPRFKRNLHSGQMASQRDATAWQGGTNGVRHSPCLIAFRRLTLRSATGTPQRGDPYQSKSGAEGTIASGALPDAC